MIFGVFAFNNPDVIGENHCWVNPGMFEPVPMAAEPDEGAVDGTAAILSVFKWQFLVNLLLLCFAGLIMVGSFFNMPLGRLTF